MITGNVWGKDMLRNKKIVALCTSRIQDESTNEYVTALHKALSNVGYSLFVYNTSTTIVGDEFENDPQVAVYKLINYDVVDVVIVCEEVIRNKSLSNYLVECAKAHGVKTIVIGEAYKGCVNIKFDHENGFLGIVRHIVCDHKRTKLHMMAGIKGNYFSDQRIEAFKRVLEENDLPFDDSMVSYGDFWSEPAEKAVEELLAKGELPEAFICANDNMAVAVSNLLQNHGIKVPEEVAVTGFDGILDAKFCSPRITTVVTDYTDLAQQTMEILEDWDSWIGKRETALVPLRVLIAQSCGCNGERTINASEYLTNMSNRFYRFREEDIALSATIANIQRCEKLEDITRYISNEIFYESCCVLEQECINETVNPEHHKAEFENFDRKVVLLFDRGQEILGRPYLFQARQVIPAINYMLDEKRLLIFSSLYYLDVSLGYMCFYYKDLTSTNYVKVPQIMNALSNAMGGYCSARHKQYLMGRIDEMYRTDMLTGLRNRRGFEAEYREMLESCQENRELTVIFVDLDGLKYINDNYGHKEGDFAIHTVAKAMKILCPEGAIFTRFGGDEMLAVCRGKQDIEKLKEDFYGYFDAFNAKSNKKYDVLASMGIYHTEEGDDLSFEGIIEKSDVLMYMEKTKRKKLRVK